MTLLRVQSNLSWITGLPEDVTVNTFHLSADLGTFSGPDLLTGWIEFMDTAGVVFSTLVRRTGHLLRVYDTTDPEPRAPIYEETWDLTDSPSGAILPPEVAYVVSYQGVRVSGQPQARRRGRMYLGPCNTGMNVLGRPELTPEDLVPQAMVDLWSFLDTKDMPFVIYSRADDDFVVPAQAWVDNSWDTQRRRGLTATERYTVDV